MPAYLTMTQWAHHQEWREKNALLSLEDILKQPLNEYIRDGVIQRFEYTFELSWKIIARYFKEIGREDLPHGPRPLIKEAGKEGLINDVEAWLRFLESRNKSTHIYNGCTRSMVGNLSKQSLLK